jgi:hypothetical protein
MVSYLCIMEVIYVFDFFCVFIAHRSSLGDPSKVFYLDKFIVVLL